MIFDQRLGYHHKQCRRDAFAGHIRDHDPEMILIDQEEVIKVSAYLFCRLHCCVNIKFTAFRKRREDLRQHIRLNLGRHIKLCTDPLLLCRDLCDVLDIPPHLVRHLHERFRQDTCLIMRFIFPFERKMVALYLLHALCQPFDRLHYPPGKPPRSKEQQDKYDNSHKAEKYKNPENIFINSFRDLLFRLIDGFTDTYGRRQHLVSVDDGKEAPAHRLNRRIGDIIIDIPEDNRAHSPFALTCGFQRTLQFSVRTCAHIGSIAILFQRQDSLI